MVLDWQDMKNRLRAQVKVMIVTLLPITLAACAATETAIFNPEPISQTGQTLIEISETDKIGSEGAQVASNENVTSQSVTLDPKPRPAQTDNAANSTYVSPNERQKALEAAVDTSGRGDIVGCPYVEIPRGAEVYQIYDKRGQGDPLALVYQASVNDTATNCSLDGNNNLRISVGIDGRLVQGPRGKSPLAVKIPVAIVLRNKENKAIFDKVFRVDVRLERNQSATRFAQVYDNIVVAAQGGKAVSVDDIRVEAGFPPPPEAK